MLRSVAGMASVLVLVFTVGWHLHRPTELGHAVFGGVTFCRSGLGIAVPGLAVSDVVALD